jgi:hypothetical protein
LASNGRYGTKRGPSVSVSLTVHFVLGAFAFLVLQQRKEPLSALLTQPLVLAHYFQFRLGAACILMLPFQVNDQRLLLGQPSFSFNDIALQLPQLIEKCIVNHQKHTIILQKQK